jgi:polyhydroxyalkanoate synthase
VTNPVGRIVPPRSVLDGLEAAPGLDYRIVSYEGDRGPMLQHLGPLVAPSSHERIWPEIFDWMDGLPAA